MNNNMMNGFLLSNQNAAVPIYRTTLSTSSNWSCLSTSSGFESQPESFDFDLINYEPQSANQLSSNFYNNNNFFSQQPQIQNQQQQQLGSIQPNQIDLDNSMDSDIFTSDNCNYDLMNQQQLQQQHLEDNDIHNNFSSPTLTTFNLKENENYLGNAAMQMWQFLLELLEDKRCKHLIRWSSPAGLATFEKSYCGDNEFQIFDSAEIARRWSIRSGKPNMNYKKFNRVLRYYYNKKNILLKTAGKRNTYQFQINIQPYLNQAHMLQYQQMQQHHHSFSF